MTMYQCDKGHTFLHSAKMTKAHKINAIDAQHPFPEQSVEYYVCPICITQGRETLTYSEFVESEPQVEAVYVYDLTSGPQTELAGLLAQGYVIKNRYAKQYVLEKCKQIEAKTESIEGVGTTNWSGKTE